MKRTTRKLEFRVETVRNLTKADLSRAAGGFSSAKAGMCSTEDHNTHCACPDFTLDCGVVTDMC